jgi:hypothetical protein
VRVDRWPDHLGLSVGSLALCNYSSWEFGFAWSVIDGLGRTELGLI